MLRVELTAELSDAHDGLSRPLGDIARFGRALMDVHMKGGVMEKYNLALTFGGHLDHLEKLSYRFARHPSVEKISAELVISNEGIE